MRACAWRDGCARSPHNVTRCATAHTAHVSRDVPPSSAGFIIDEGGRGEPGRLARAVGIPPHSARRHGCTRRPLVFAAWIPQGPDARHTEVFRMCRVSGHKGAAPFGKVEFLTDEVGGVFDGLTKQDKQKVATRSAQRTRTPAAWRSEVSRPATRQVCGSGQSGTSPGARPATTPVFRRPPVIKGPPHPPTTRGISRDEPLPPDGFQISGGSQGWGVRGWKGRRGGAGFCRVCPRWRSGLGRCGWRCPVLVVMRIAVECL